MQYFTKPMQYFTKPPDELIQAVLAAGEDPAAIDAEGWTFNPKTRYLRCYKFALREEGGRLINRHKLESQRVRITLKIPKYWARRLERVLQA